MVATPLTEGLFGILGRRSSPTNSTQPRRSVDLVEPPVSLLHPSEPAPAWSIRLCEGRSYTVSPWVRAPASLLSGMDKPLYKDFRSRHELNFVLRGFFHVGGTVPLTNPHGVSSSSLLGACIALRQGRSGTPALHCCAPINCVLGRDTQQQRSNADRDYLGVTALRKSVPWR
jgi:hypothetical protein